MQSISCSPAVITNEIKADAPYETTTHQLLPLLNSACPNVMLVKCSYFGLFTVSATFLSVISLQTTYHILSHTSIPWRSWLWISAAMENRKWPLPLISLQNSPKNCWRQWRTWWGVMGGVSISILGFCKIPQKVLVIVWFYKKALSANNLAFLPKDGLGSLSIVANPCPAWFYYIHL